MAEFFIRRPIVAMVIAIVTVIVGMATLSRLPIAEYPQVSPTLIEVTANYRGAAAEAVMDSVATPIESKVNGVDKMLYMHPDANGSSVAAGCLYRFSAPGLQRQHPHAVWPRTGNRYCCRRRHRCRRGRATSYRARPQSA
jgi:hypothetical protein